MTNTDKRNILITGGAGFVGSNLAQRLLTDPTTRVTIFDDLSRPGVNQNLTWLKSTTDSSRLRFVRGDVRNSDSVKLAVNGMTEIYHLAAQVAVTTSISEPRHDFDTNVLGTFNVLEAARLSELRPFLLFTSTNKVYGSLNRVAVVKDSVRYRPLDSHFHGVDETEALDFHSPYGCSKGSADQYVRDYARIYDLPTVVFRMSCIAGPRQFGNEDQGWVAHLLYSILSGQPITIYGDGLQVRDVLHVHDLLDAIEAAYVQRKRTSGQIYNVGGGTGRTTSVLELIHLIAETTGKQPITFYADLRAGDQPWYISDTNRLTTHTGWKATFSVRETLESIQDFWQHNHGVLAALYSDHSREKTATAELVREVVA